MPPIGQHVCDNFEKILCEGLDSEHGLRKVLARRTTRNGRPIAYSTLCYELNPKSGKGRYPARDLPLLMDVGGPEPILNYLCTLFDIVWFRLPNPEDGPIDQSMALAVQEFGKLMTEYGGARSATSDGGQDISTKKAKALRKKGLETIQAVSTFLASLDTTNNPS